MADRSSTPRSGTSSCSKKSKPRKMTSGKAATGGRGGASAGSGGSVPTGSSGVVDRRLGLDRREIAQRSGSTLTGLERRRGPGRRRSDFTKAAEEGEMTREQFLFLMAIDAFKRANGAVFPTWTDVLEVVRLLGYRKTMASELNLPSAEDWREAPFGEANVRPDRWGERFEDDELAAIGEAGGGVDGEVDDDALILDADDDLDLDGLSEAA